MLFRTAPKFIRPVSPDPEFGGFANESDRIITDGFLPLLRRSKALADGEMNPRHLPRACALRQAEAVLVFVVRGRSLFENIQLIADDDQKERHD